MGSDENRRLDKQETGGSRGALRRAMAISRSGGCGVARPCFDWGLVQLSGRTPPAHGQLGALGKLVRYARFSHGKSGCALLGLGRVNKARKGLGLASKKRPQLSADVCIERRRCPWRRLCPREHAPAWTLPAQRRCRQGNSIMRRLTSRLLCECVLGRPWPLFHHRLSSRE